MSAARREALLEALHAYRGEGRSDPDSVTRFRRFLERDDLFHRGDSDGHVTASAIVAPLSDISPVDRDGSLERAARKAVTWLARP